MKKLLLLPLLLFTFCGSAQLRGGQWMTGGYADFLRSGSHQTINEISTDIKGMNLQLAVDGGFFIIDQLSVGLWGGVLLSEDKQTIDRKSNIGYYSYSKDKSFGYVAGPFVRYYFLKPQHRLNIFADLSYGYSHNKQKSKTFEQQFDPSHPLPPSIISVTKTEQKINAHTFAVSVGPAFFINPSSSLELSIGYSYMTYIKSKASSNNLSASLGLQAFFGK